MHSPPSHQKYLVLKWTALDPTGYARAFRKDVYIAGRQQSRFSKKKQGMRGLFLG